MGQFRLVARGVCGGEHLGTISAEVVEAKGEIQVR